jgi:leader peptidase (prepilin peptidase) / N-methyltransferase
MASSVVVALMLSVILAAISWTDFRLQIIPDHYNIALAIGGVVSMFVLGIPSVMDAVIGSIVGGFSFFLISQIYVKIRNSHGLGFGDVKFVSAAGLWTGASCLPWFVLLSCCSALAFAIAVSIYQQSLDGKLRIAFAPHLSFGLLATWSATTFGVW